MACNFHQNKELLRLPELRWLAVAAVVILSGFKLKAAAPQETAPPNPVQSGQGAGQPEEPRSEQKPLAPKIELAGRGIIDETPIPSFQENSDEAHAYCDALTTAHYASVEALANSGRRDVTFAHLFEQPNVYRGQVIHVEGRLKRVRKFEAPNFVWSQGIRDLYEGWIFDPEIYGANPMCLVFTDMPPGLQVAEKMDRLVSFDGYFFKKYRYQAGDARRDSPLLIGHMPVLVAERTAADSGSGPISMGFVWIGTALLGGTVLTVVGLAWWYRRGDRRIRARLAATRAAGLEDVEFGQSPVPGNDQGAGLQSSGHNHPDDRDTDQPDRPY